MRTTNILGVTLLVPVIIAALALVSAPTANAAMMTDHTQHMATGTMGTPSMTTGTKVMVMNHLCNANIKNKDDFQEIQKGLDPVAALAATVLACPTTGLPGDEAVANTVASPRTQYEFRVSGENGSSMLSDASYSQHKLCESDIHLDANHDGMIATSTCLDISHYMFPASVGAGHDARITVTETDPPMGRHFGALKFTPTVLDGNNDAASLVSVMPDEDSGEGTITLKTATDTDGMIMLHVYNFVDDQTGGGTSSGGHTSDDGSLSDAIKMLLQEIKTLQQRILELLGRH